MVLDLQRVELKEAIHDGALWVVEQIPGYRYTVHVHECSCITNTCVHFKFILPIALAEEQLHVHVHMYVHVLQLFEKTL